MIQDNNLIRKGILIAKGAMGNNNLVRKGIIISIIISLLYILFVDYLCWPWCDEIGTADSAVNYVLTGKWFSHVWTYTYNPLHNLILTAWLYIWGVSRASVCSLSVFLALIAYSVLIQILYRRTILKSSYGLLMFTILFWGGWEFLGIILMGRIDTLVLFFFVLTIDSIIPFEERSSRSTTIQLVIGSFFLMLSSVYSLPILALVCLCLFFHENNKRLMLKRYFILFCSMTISFICVCSFFYYNHSLLKFLDSIVSFSSTLSGSSGTPFYKRVYGAYRLDISAIVIFAIGFLLAFVKHQLNGKLRFYMPLILIIPFVMVLAGRYQLYYSWLFYIPCLVMFLYSIELPELNKAVKLGLVVLVLITVVFKFSVIKENYYSISKKNENIVNFLGNIDINNGDNVVFTDAQFYYHLLDAKADRWYKYKGLKETEKWYIKDYTTYKGESVSENEENRMMGELKSFLRKNEYLDDFLPQSGFLIVEKDTSQESEIFLKDHGYNVSYAYCDNNYAFLKFW